LGKFARVQRPTDAELDQQLELGVADFVAAMGVATAHAAQAAEGVAEGGAELGDRLLAGGLLLPRAPAGGDLRHRAAPRTPRRSRSLSPRRASAAPPAGPRRGAAPAPG